MMSIFIVKFVCFFFPHKNGCLSVNPTQEVHFKFERIIFRLIDLVIFFYYLILSF